MSYLGLKGTLQRAEGPGWGDDGGKAGHGRWVGVEELKKKRGRGSVRMVWLSAKCSRTASYVSGEGTNRLVTDEPQHSIFSPIFQDCLDGELPTCFTNYEFRKYSSAYSQWCFFKEKTLL